MIPLIDMFFLLLVFFIFGVFSMTMQQGILVDLPTANTAASTQEDTISISLAADGSLFVNQQPVTLQHLEATLAQIRPAAPYPLVVINADRQVPHGTVISVLDGVRHAGYQRVSFQTAPESSS
jgi:biopolymer transport protein ExbD